MTLSFKYKKIERPEPFLPENAPAIPITLANINRKVTIVGLIDSGADISCLSKEIAEYLEVSYVSDEEEIGGIGGNIKARRAKVQIRISKGNENYIFSINAYIPTQKMDDVFPLLIGREGFFEQFKITFIEAEKRIHLKKYNRQQ